MAGVLPPSRVGPGGLVSARACASSGCQAPEDAELVALGVVQHGHRGGGRAVYRPSPGAGSSKVNPLLGLVTAPLRKKVRFPIPPTHDREGVEWIADRLASGAFRPVIDRRYRLDQIVEAYRYVESGEKTGNVVIDVGLEDPRRP